MRSLLMNVARFFAPIFGCPKAATESGPKDLKQVWFAGVHCDVGGGYPEAESGLSKIALKWMLTEAIAAGLIIDAAKVDLVLGKHGGGYVSADPNAIMHEFHRQFGGWRSISQSDTSIGTDMNGGAE